MGSAFLKIPEPSCVQIHQMSETIDSHVCLAVKRVGEIDPKVAHTNSKTSHYAITFRMFLYRNHPECAFRQQMTIKEPRKISASKTGKQDGLGRGRGASAYSLCFHRHPTTSPPQCPQRLGTWCCHKQIPMSNAKGHNFVLAAHVEASVVGSV